MAEEVDNGLAGAKAVVLSELVGSVGSTVDAAILADADREDSGIGRAAIDAIALRRNVGVALSTLDIAQLVVIEDSEVAIHKSLLVFNKRDVSL